MIPTDDNPATHFIRKSDGKRFLGTTRGWSPDDEACDNRLILYDEDAQTWFRDDSDAYREAGSAMDFFAPIRLKVVTYIVNIPLSITQYQYLQYLGEKAWEAAVYGLEPYSSMPLDAHNVKLVGPDYEENGESDGPFLQMELDTKDCFDILLRNLESLFDQEEIKQRLRKDLPRIKYV